MNATTHRRGSYTLPAFIHGNFVRDLTSAIAGLEAPRVRYLEKHCFSKFLDADPKLTELRRKRAIEKWRGVELRNRSTNLRLYEQLSEPQLFTDVLVESSRVIRKMIGDKPPYHLLSGSFSGGASTSKRRQPGMVGRKYIGQQHVTIEAWPWALPKLLEASGWLSLNPEILTPEFVDGSVLFTVPKSSDIDRVACKEPDINMYLQKSVGDFLRRRLLARGVNLNDQTINQRRAQTGSLTDKGLATVDLSSASDSMTISLVNRLLPAEWFLFLNAIRSQRICVDGEWHECEMFSSMGNGFTFELESMIFYALCVSAIRLSFRNKGLSYPDVSVYGDDIIIPSKDFGFVKSILNYCGFTVNSSKSFVKGPIRESCGKHYHCGLDITPFYLRRPIKDVSDLIHILNSVREWSSSCRTSFADPCLEDLWLKYSQYVPKKFHGPANFGQRETLVAPSGSALRLTPKRKVSAGVELGDYIAWLDTAERRTHLSDRATTHVVELKTYVSRRGPLYAGTVLEFSHEL